MKLIDKYLLRNLLVPLLYCLGAFALIYVIYDLFDNLPDFVQARTPFMQTVVFYLYLLPSVMIIIAPVSLLLATLYSLSQLTKNNEMTAMRASGISLLRLVTPFLLTGVIASIVVGIVHETAGPWCSYWSVQFLEAQKTKDKNILIHIVPNLPYENEAAGHSWMIGHFNSQTYHMSNVELKIHSKEGKDSTRIIAGEGQWLDGRWWFTDVSIQKFDAQGHPKGAPTQLDKLEMSELPETPKNFIGEIKNPFENAEFLSAHELRNYINTHQDLSKHTIQRVEVDFHHRLSMPWTCVIVTMLGVPFGVQTGRRGALRGVILCLSMFFTFYFLINVGLWMGKLEDAMLTPVLAAWLPNITFFITGLILLNRIK